MIGAGILWVGWFGFNAGSSVSSDLQTAQALTVTQVAADSGGLVWLLLEEFKHVPSTVKKSSFHYRGQTEESRILSF